MTSTVRYLLNGSPRIVAGVAATRTLLDHLRLTERLTGTKEGCAEGDCGACTVALGEQDGAGGLTFRAVNSCILPAAAVDGKAVVTVEGLADEGGRPHPAQQAMVELHGSQCGFCTPGFVMSLFAHERAGLDAETDTVHDTLSGNLCRCTGYRPIVEALRQVALRGPDPDFDARTLAWAGRLDALLSEAGDAPSDPAGDYIKPTSLDALDHLLAARPQAKLIAGGTDLGVAIAKHAANPGSLVDVTGIPELAAITEDADTVTIGAATTYEAALPVLDRRFPAFAQMVRRIGSRQVRNRGTIGGNLANASPIGDCAPCLLALDAEVGLRSAAGRRAMKLDDFFLAYRRTALAPGEYLEWIRIPTLRPGQIFRAYKLAKRFDQDISTVAAAFRLSLEGGVATGVRAGFGGMAATPARAPTVEAVLEGSTLDPAVAIAAAAAVATDFRPLTDFRGSATYRLAAAGGLVRRLAAELADSQDIVTEVWAL